MMPMGFEYGLRKPLNVIHTTPADWQLNGVDLCGFVGRVNAIKKTHAVFLEESPTNILGYHNPNILLMWKASAKHKDEALLVLNKDMGGHQDFHTDHFRHFVQAGAPLRDVSPEYPQEYLHEPFHYRLRPGQGMVLVTRRS
jgi:starch synthase (maltosyl-transferring)